MSTRRYLVLCVQVMTFPAWVKKQPFLIWCFSSDQGKDGFGSTCLCLEEAHLASTHISSVKASPVATPDIKELCWLTLPLGGQKIFCMKVNS